MESQYLVIIQVCRPGGPRQSVQQQLTYEVTHLRPGQNRWALVSQEDFPPCPPAEQKTLRASSR